MAIADSEGASFFKELVDHGSVVRLVLLGAELA